jgi:hypothetical protein
VEELLAQKPKLRILLRSGYTDHKSLLPLIQEKGFRFPRKPYALADLLTVLRDMLSM